MTLRDTEARLAREVEDSILTNLGYNDYQVWAPGELAINPNPIVSEMNESRMRQTFSEQVLSSLAPPNRPAIVWEVKIPRTYQPGEIRTDGVWYLQPNGETRVACYPVTMQKTAARWVVYLAPQRR